MALEPRQVPAPQPAPQTSPDGLLATDTGPVWGLQENGDFLVRLAGTDWRLAADQIAQAQLNLRDKPQPMPGLEFRTARFDSRQRKLSITAGLAIPNLADGELTLEIDRNGDPKLRGTLSRAFALPALGRTTLTLGLDENFALAGMVEVLAANLMPAGIRGLTATGAGTIHLAGRTLSGSGSVTIAYNDLGGGTVDFRFDQEGKFTGSGRITITPPFLSPINADVAADAQGNIKAYVETALAGQTSPVPNLTLTGGAVAVDYLNGRPSLTLTDFVASYAGFGAVSIANVALDTALRPSGSGSFTANIPMLTTTAGTVTVRSGRISGQITLGKDSFPEGLPIRSGSIIARLGEDGQLGFSGNVSASFGPAGNADVAAAYGPEGFAISGAADLTIPGLNPIHLNTSYQNGDLAGSVQVPVDTALLPGLTDNVTVSYAQGRWSGLTILAFSADNGKLSGTVTVTVAQNDAGAIELGGTGSVTAQLMPGLQGTLIATILPAGGIDVSGEIVVTDPYELFPEQRQDKQLFSYSQNIPLWAILVAVIRVRSGIRAGIGPGVFRNIKVIGSYTFGSEASDPSFSISGEMFIPAFIEGYVAFGAGLGLDVGLGSLTCGIEGVATAGLYGAISVVPELDYADGNWSIDGTATMAAGARFKLGLNAWAEVEALWVTVWEQTWKLAEVVMPVGPDLSLQAHMHYTFGRPEAPTLDFNTSDIDTGSLIQSAMPADAPPASGARQALENKAEWKGALKEKKEAPVPPKQAAQANASPAPPAPPTKPPHLAPPGGGAAATGSGPNASPGATPTNANAPARSSAVDKAAKPDPNAAGTVPDSALPAPTKPRYPNGITLAMLDEPPVPAERTAQQQQDDLNAAKQVLDLASAQSTDSDTLDNYFPQVKDRFRLTSLGYAGSFATGFKVVGKINPEFEVTYEEPLSGTGIPAGLGRQTNIVHGSTNLGGDTVGYEMVAMPLGPDHPEGTPPSGQRTLMDKLPTGYKENPGDAQANFVQGHLLNDWLGGKGKDFNLFPITAHANNLHSSMVEETVKKWVNKKRFWTKYEVKFKVIKYELDSIKADNYVDSTFDVTVSVLNTKLEPIAGLTRSVTIKSVFKQPATGEPGLNEDLTKLGKHEARKEDLDFTDVKGTSRARDTGPPSLQDGMQSWIRNGIKRYGTDKFKQKVRNYNGVGDVLLEVIFKAYDAVKLKSDKTLGIEILTPEEQTNFRRAETLWESGLNTVT